MQSCVYVCMHDKRSEWKEMQLTFLFKIKIHLLSTALAIFLSYYPLGDTKLMHSLLISSWALFKIRKSFFKKIKARIEQNVNEAIQSSLLTLCEYEAKRTSQEHVKSRCNFRIKKLHSHLSYMCETNKCKV